MPSNLDNLLNKIQKLLSDKDRIVVAICGFGGSGKTTISKQLGDHFKDAQVVSLDDFLINHGEGKGWAGGYGWDRFEGVLKGIKAGRDLHYQKYDWRKNEPGHWIDEKLSRLIIVEGVRILQPRFMNYYDLSVWVNVALSTATARGVARDKENWQDKSDLAGIEEHLNTWRTTWAPKDKEYFEKFHPDQLADIVIEN